MEAADWAEIGRFVELGSVLAGKYRIDRLIGVGGMGAVVEAHHQDLGESVAIKFLLPRTLGKSQQSARFFREARAASRLKSAHVARVFDVDRRADGTPYIVMEYLTGETLAKRLAREKHVTVAEFVDEVLEACEAIAEAHSLGMAHRDLKPANLFLSRGAGNLVTLKVLDFGILKHLGAEGDGHDATTGESPIGSPPYMSPEQLTRPADVDHRTDIWSLGVCLYEGLGAKAPFAAPGFGELCAQILQHQPPPLDTLRPELAPGLVALVERCLKKDRAERFASISELSHALVTHGSERARRSLAVIDAIAAPAVPLPRAGDSGDVEQPAMDTGTLTAATDSAAPRSSVEPAPTVKRGWLIGALSLAALIVVARWLHDDTADGPGSPPTEGSTPSASRAHETSSVVPPAPSAAAAPGVARSATSASAAASASPPPRSKLVGAGLAPPRPTASPVPAPARSFDPVYEDRK